MNSVSVSQLRRNLQTFLSKAATGERVRITSHGRPIAEIGPPVAAGKDAAAARERLRGSVLKYSDPAGPALAEHEWHMLR